MMILIAVMGSNLVRKEHLRSLMKQSKRTIAKSKEIIEHIEFILDIFKHPRELAPVDTLTKTIAVLGGKLVNFDVTWQCDCDNFREETYRERKE